MGSCSSQSEHPVIRWSVPEWINPAADSLIHLALQQSSWGSWGLQFSPNCQAAAWCWSSPHHSLCSGTRLNCWSKIISQTKSDFEEGLTQLPSLKTGNFKLPGNDGCAFSPYHNTLSMSLSNSEESLELSVDLHPLRPVVEVSDQKPSFFNAWS